jgi:SMI1 / KNR4 family (SUKH-1)
MDLEELARLIGPPPRQTPPIDWAAVEQTLGLRLPSDYKAFTSAYGSIDLGEFVWVWSPARTVPFEYHTHEWLRASRDLDPPSYPYTFWPEPGGLLMWGRSRASHHFFWCGPARWEGICLRQWNGHPASRRDLGGRPAG